MTGATTGRFRPKATICARRKKSQAWAAMCSICDIPARRAIISRSRISGSAPSRDRRVTSSVSVTMFAFKIDSSSVARTLEGSKPPASDRAIASRPIPWAAIALPSVPLRYHFRLACRRSSIFGAGFSVILARSRASTTESPRRFWTRPPCVQRLGLGLTYVSPFGPIEIDLAVPLIDESFDKSELFRFSFGTRF